ncbi:hypothetical protein [Massilia sp. BJB1822]|uniref:hypothetical protein n=1 Tax=Massilia sp. BJB1822 TaxID=2744470 RepID=UPI001593CE85|nr:hypothetical protein [Massilia sp. BJB1822]NVD98227.1 hypothetical protein [Massilia sp. BJB1822]
MLNSSSRFRSPRLQGSTLLLLIGGFAALALALMWWRWGGTVEDSLAYYDTARYLRGEIPVGELRAPFPYRLLVPALAALAPGELHNSFATLNWLCITAAAVMIALTVQRLQLGRERAIVGGLLLIVSVPTVWYAPYLLVDPGAICARAAFVLAVVSGQPWLAAGAGILATAVREENIVLLFWLLAARQISLGAGLLALASAGGWLLAVRWWLITGLPSYVWAPSLQTLLNALADVRSLASIAAAVSLVLPLSLLGMRQAPPALRPLKSLLLLLALPPLYAALSVRVDGRAVWSLYPLLIPFAMCWRRPDAAPTTAGA